MFYRNLNINLDKLETYLCYKVILTLQTHFLKKQDFFKLQFLWHVFSVGHLLLDGDSEGPQPNADQSEIRIKDFLNNQINHWRSTAKHISFSTNMCILEVN